MLVLARKPSNSVRIGPEIKVTVLKVRGRQVRLGIEAPPHIEICREELIPYGFDVKESKSVQRPQRAKDLRVFVVEDDPDHVELICLALAEAGITDVMAANSAEEALNNLDAKGSEAIRPHIILLDLNLPGMSGLDLLRRIKSHQALAVTPVIILSSSAYDDDAAVCLRAGASAFVTKEMNYNKFRTSVSRIAHFWGEECRLPRSATVSAI